MGTTAFYFGFDRITAQDVNPIIYKVVDNAVVWVRDDYETSSDDSITSGLVWDGDARLYATFTASSLLATGFPTGSGWLPVLATTGALVQANAKVSVLVQIDPATGDALAGTFISSLLSTGKSNSMFPVMLDIGLSETGDTQVLFEGGSSFNPRETDTTRMTDTGGYNAPHPYRVLFNETLSVALAAEAIGYNNVTGLSLTAGEHICEGQGNKAVPAPLWATIVIAIGITTIVIGTGRQSRPFF